MKKNNILYITNVSWFFISHRIALARECKRLGWDVHLLSRVEGGIGPLIELGVVVHNWRISRGIAGIFSELYSLYQLVSIVKREKPELIHVIGMKSILMTSLALFNKRSLDVVFAVSGLGASLSGRSSFSKLLSKFISGVIFNFVKRNNVAFIVQNIQDELVVKNNLCDERTKILITRGSGVSLDDYKPALRKIKVNDTDIIVLIACRMLWDKGVGDVADVASRFEENKAKVKFVFAGPFDPDSPSAIPEKVLLDWNNRTNITWLGHVDDMPSLFYTSDIFVYPSRYGEGTPKVLLEASASSLPIVTTDWPGCREVVEEGLNGYLVSPGSISDIYRAIEKLVENRDKISDFGRYSRKLAEQYYDVNEVVDKTFDLYCNLVAPEGDEVILRS